MKYSLDWFNKQYKGESSETVEYKNRQFMFDISQIKATHETVESDTPSMESKPLLADEILMEGFRVLRNNNPFINAITK